VLQEATHVSDVHLDGSRAVRADPEFAVERFQRALVIIGGVERHEEDLSRTGYAGKRRGSICFGHKVIAVSSMRP
jgi:hypothetical protein